MFKLEIEALNPDWGYDKDEIAFHAVFQCLCDFIEREKAGGVQGYKEWVKWCEEEGVNEPGIQRSNLELYEWYRSVDWSEERYDPGLDTIYTERLRRAIECMGSWWT